MEEQFVTPGNLDLEKIFKAKGLEKELKHLYKYEYFISLIFCKQKSENEYVLLNQKILRRVIPYFPVLRRIRVNLENWGIIECDYLKEYSRKYKKKNSKSYGYKLTPLYFNALPPNYSTNNFIL